MGKSKQPEPPEERTFLKALRKAKSAAHDTGFDPSTDDRINELVYQLTVRVAAVYRQDMAKEEGKHLEELSAMYTRIMDYENRYMDLRYGLEHMRNALVERKMELNNEILSNINDLIDEDDDIDEP